MPRVPVTQEFGVAEAATPTPVVRAPDSPDVVGAQLTGLGLATQNMAAVAQDFAAEDRQRMNRVRVEEELNHLREAGVELTIGRDTGYQNAVGRDVFSRPSGKPLADEYTERFDQGVKKFAGNLSNDWQKQTFMQHAMQLRQQFRQGALNHEATQSRHYQESVHTGAMALAVRDLALNPTAADRVAEAEERIRGNALALARLGGQSATEAESVIQKTLAAAHADAFEAVVAAGDMASAAQYLGAHGSKMNGAQVLAANKLLRAAMGAQQVAGIADRAVEHLAPRMVPSDFDRLWGVMEQAESGGRQVGPDGAPLTSPKGAVGVAQVMPSTGPEAAKLAGVEWDEERLRNDENYNRALGQAYMQSMLQRFGGDAAKAMAAYNAGPAAVMVAGKRAEREGVHWLSLLPQETQTYVQRNLAEFNAGGGAPRAPTLADVHREVLARLPADATDEQRGAAMTAAERRFRAFEDDVKSKRDFAVAEAMRELVKSGGDMEALPPLVRSRIPIEQLDSVMSFAKTLSTREDVTTNLALFQYLSNEKNLRGLSDDEFFALRSQLSQSDFESFATARGKPPADTGAGAFPATSVANVLQDRLAQIGINASPPATEKRARARVGAINQFVRQSILDAQATLGRKLTDAEVEQHIDQMFSRQTTISGWMGPRQEPAMGIDAGEIPAAVREGLVREFRAQGIDSPTDAQMLDAYWRSLR